MALFRPGPIVAAVSGSIDSITFSNGPRGSRVGRRLRRSNRQTTAQMSSRAALTYARGLWTRARDDQRLFWRVAASERPRLNRVGTASPLTGFQMFVAVNALRYKFGLSPQFNAPAPQTRPALYVDLFAVTGATSTGPWAAQMTIRRQDDDAFTGPAIVDMQAGLNLPILTGGQPSTQTNRTYSPWKNIGYYPTQSGLLVITTPLEELYPPIYNGRVYRARVRHWDAANLPSPPVYATTAANVP